ncbi:MAG: hypothetical protein L0Z71_05580 [Anaerolineae bacterium]|nr:hypothetical protein [Anaerolineae bacterium]
MSINRIAADDDAETVIVVFQESLALFHRIHALCDQYGIIPLNAESIGIVHRQLFGQNVEISSTWRSLHKS